MTTALVTGSITEVALKSGKSLALAFMAIETVVLVDTSGSMAANDSRGGKSRYDVACTELSLIQANNPGKVLILSFSDNTEVCLNGIPKFLCEGTMVSQALNFAKQYDLPGMKFILISDGEPLDPDHALEVAKTYQNAISTVYVGPPDELSGRKFLEKLASLTGGKTVTADRAKELAQSISQLLLKA
jgi:hypothetical protein